MKGAFVESLLKKAGVSDEDKELCKKCSRQEVLEKMSPQEIQLLSAIPPKMQDKIWKALGIAE